MRDSGWWSHSSLLLHHSLLVFGLCLLNMCLSKEVRNEFLTITYSSFQIILKLLVSFYSSILLWSFSQLLYTNFIVLKNEQNGHEFSISLDIKQFYCNFLLFSIQQTLWLYFYCSHNNFLIVNFVYFIGNFLHWYAWLIKIVLFECYQTGMFAAFPSMEEVWRRFSSRLYSLLETWTAAARASSWFVSLFGINLLDEFTGGLLSLDMLTESNVFCGG